jgi:colanic acid biosynthesis glycosyl transferase WcaI
MPCPNSVQPLLNGIVVYGPFPWPCGTFRKRLMRKLGKVVIVSQHYPPDRSTTAAIMKAIAEHLAAEVEVLILSGTAGSARDDSTSPNQPAVVEIKNWRPAKAALIRRAAAEAAFTFRAFRALLKELHKGDVVLTVTAPFTLPYAVAAAARLKRARSVLIMHDLFPEVLVMAGLLRATSVFTRLMRGTNSLMFRTLNAVVTIGRDTEQHLLRYRGMAREKIWFIPNWATLVPGVRPIVAGNSYRPSGARFVVGLSGNLGFTHDPVTVFDAARLLQDEPDIHFLLSGWGIGFERLKALQAETALPNVTLLDRVPEENLEQFLSAANLWLIPYRKNVAGISVPSRFYNLLAVGRPVIIVSEPDAEAALTVTEHGVGWVVAPGKPDELAQAIRVASFSRDALQAERAAAIAVHFSFSRAMASYSELVQNLLRKVP